MSTTIFTRAAMRASLLAFALALGVSACRDSTGPATGRDLRIGTITAGRIAAGETATYDLDLAAGERVALYFQAMDAHLTLQVIDPAGTSLGIVGDVNNPDDLERRFLTVLATRDGRHIVRISAAASGGGGFRIRPSAIDYAPESAPAELTLGVTVAEAIDQRADVDEFTFMLGPNEEAIAFLQQIDPGAPTIGASIQEIGSQATFPYWESLSAAESNADFESTARGRFGSSTGSTYRITVHPGFDAPSAAVRYRLLVRPIDRRPEHVPAALVPGDTISEAIDHVGDIDEYALSGTPGAEYNVFVGADGVAPHRAVVTLDMPGDFVATADPGVALLRNPTRRFVMPATGTVTVRVADARDRDGLYRGPYRLYVHRVDRAPEGRAAEITLATGPIVGMIEVPGDIDEYTLRTTEPAVLNLFLTRRPDGAFGGGVWVEVIPAIGGERIAWTGTPPWSHGSVLIEVGVTGRFTLPAGSYRVRVDAKESGITGFMGTYELELYPVNPAPEIVPATIAIGDTVRGESIDRAGDMDTFRFSGTAADTITVVMTPVAGDTLNMHAFTVRSLATGLPVGYESYTSIWDGRGHRETGRIQLPGTGQYEVVVRTEGRTMDERGAYELFIERVSARPEHRSAIVAIGDTVRGEPIDLPGDIDTFVLRGTPGSEFGAAFQWMKAPVVNFQIVDPASGHVLVTQASAGWIQYTGRTIFPAGGELHLRVLQGPTSCEYINPCIDRFSFAGDYMFFTFPLNRLPEVNAPAVAIGDTISGDRVDPPGDVDEFTFDGTAGQVIDVYFQTPMGTCCFGGLTLDLIDPETSAVLGSVPSVNPTTRLDDQGIRGVTLPASRRYVIRVRGTDERYGTGVYRFQVVVR